MGAEENADNKNADYTYEEHEIEASHKDILSKNPEAELVRALLCCESAKELQAFLADICTPGELKALAERLVIARLLDQGGLSYRDISAATGASTTTVGRVARFLQQEPHKGYQLVLQRIKGRNHETNINPPDTGDA